MKRTLVVGAGMVGAHVLSDLVRTGVRPVVVDVRIDRAFLDSIVPPDTYEAIRGSITDREFVSETFRSHDIDVAINTAAVLPMRVGHSAHPGFYEVNTWGAANLMFRAIEAGVRRVVQFSTNGVYQFRKHDVTRPVSEDFPTGLTKGNSYANSKAASEYLLHELREEGRLDGVIVRPAEVFGTVVSRPGDDAIYWQQMLDAAIDGRELVLRGEPEHRLDWVYCRDVARLAVLLATRPNIPPHPAYNAALGQVLGIYDWLDALDEVFPNHGVRLKNCGRGGWEHPLSTDRARTDLGFEAEYGLQEGIRDYAAWRQDGLSPT